MFLWLIVAAFAGHRVFDFFRRLLIQNPGVPKWWRGFCLSFDALTGGFLATLLMRRSGFAWKVWNDGSNPTLPVVVPIASQPMQLLSQLEVPKLP